MLAMHRSRASARKCKLAGELLACSFCTNVYHNSDACLHEDKVLDTLDTRGFGMLSVGVPGMFQKGDRCSPAGRAQTRRPAWSRCGEASHASKDVVGMRAPKLVHQLSCLAAHLAHLTSNVLPSAFPAHLTSDMLPFRRALHAV